MTGVQLVTSSTSGTFTPTISFGGASVGVTYGTQSGTYTLVGNRVIFDLIVVISAKGSSTGAAVIGGLPFTAANTVLKPVSPYMTGLGAGTDAHQIECALIPNTATVGLYLSVLGVIQALQDNSFGATPTIALSGHYNF